MPRCLVPVLLIGLVLACPLLCGPCGAADIGHGSTTSDGSGHEHGGNGCPEDSDNCVCRGAIQSLETRSVSPSTDLPSLVCLLAPIDPPLPPDHHLTGTGGPTGLAGWGSSLTIRALLQNFQF